MRLVTIKRVVDASAHQGRVILNLSCGHNISLAGNDLPANFIAGSEINCEHCPDVSPEETRLTKSPIQLYREAMEPDV